MRTTIVLLAAACAPTHPSHESAPALDIAGLLTAHENFGGALSPDGTKLLFRSDRDGVAELYIADVAHPEAPATKLVAGPERISSAAWASAGRVVLFRRDTGADEIFHIWRVAADAGATPEDLTPDAPLWRDSPIPVDAAADMIVYSARTPTDYASMIFVHDLRGGKPAVVYRDPGPGTVLDVAPGGRTALWYREATTGGHDILEVDLVSGVTREIEPRDGTATMATAAAYSSDGSRIFVATDHGSERHVVVALDRMSLAEVATYTQQDPPTAEISAIVPSPRGDRLAITIDAGNRSSVRLLDARTLATVGDVRTPLGTATAGTISETRVRLGTNVFSQDGAHFVAQVSLPDAPADLYLVDTATAAAVPARREARPALAKLPPITVSIANVRSFDGLVVPVNVYVPAHATSRVPVVLWLHGGPDASTPVAWDAWTRVLAAAGYAVLEPNIRGSTGFGRAYARADDREKRWDALRDLAAVNAWARAQPWCDSGHIVIAGGSFGGYYTLMALAHQPELWSAGIDLAGPSDLHAMLTRRRDAPKRYVEELGDPVADRRLLDELSPIHAVDRIRAPLLVYQGVNDSRVSRSHADAIVAALRERHVPVDYMLVGDEGHSVARRANELELLTRMLKFLQTGVR